MEHREYAVGGWYLVPHVRAQVGLGTKLVAIWLPVYGPLHDDREIIGFPDPHYHLDFRFLTEGAKEVLHTVHQYFDSPFLMVITKVIPQHPNALMPNAYPVMRFRELVECDVPADRYFRHIPARCNTLTLAEPYPATVWGWGMAKAFQNACLSEDRICPHRGADLSSIEPEGGIITCPLHGLMWDAETGRAMPLGTERPWTPRHA